MNTLQDQLNEVTNQIANETDPSVLAGFEQKKAVITMQLEDEKAKQEQEAAQQVRIQTQEEKVESIKLPYDFNEVFDDPRANEMITELIKDLQRQAYADHNAEVELLVAENKTQVAELKAKNDDLQLEYNRLHIDMESMSKALIKRQDDLADALSKRDAAAREIEGLETLLEEKQAHIDKLREEIAIGAKAAVNVTSIAPSDRLAALVQESKSAKIKSSIELALERTEPIRGKIDVVAPPKALEEATFPTQASNTANIGLDNSQASGIPADHQEVTFQLPTATAPEVHTAPITVVEGQQSVEVPGETVEDRLAALEAHVFGFVKQAS